jgi:hypothetical protein
MILLNLPNHGNNIRMSYERVKRNIVDELHCVDPVKFQQISYTGTSQQSAEFQSNTTMIWLFATTDCWVKISSNPVAVPGDGDTFLLRSGFYHPYTVVRNSQKIAAVQSTTAGSLDIQEAR